VAERPRPAAAGPGDERRLRGEQYASDRNLSARLGLHQRFSTNPESWYAWLLRQLELAPGARVLDIGCGNAAFWSANRADVPPGLELTLADFSPGMLAAAGEALRGSRVPARRVAANASALPFPPARFDTVLANHMLYHVEALDRALGELARVLRPRAPLFATTNGDDHMREVDELREAVGLAPQRFAYAARFGLASGASLLRTLFRDVRVTRYPNHLRVTEPEAIVAYVASMTPLTPDRTRSLHDRARRRIAATGHFHVTIDSGLIAAR
jgi:SAM-dependent methyltransferase